MEQVRERVAPEAVGARLERPLPAEAVAQIEVGRRAAGDEPALAAGCRVLEAMGGQKGAGDAVGAAEYPPLTEWPVGDELHRILAVEHRQVHGVVAARARRIE